MTGRGISCLVTVMGTAVLLGAVTTTAIAQENKAAEDNQKVVAEEQKGAADNQNGTQNADQNADAEDVKGTEENKKVVAEEEQAVAEDKKPEEYMKRNVLPDHEEGGKWFTADDIPTFNITEDGKLDWPSYSGFRRYHSECHVCHGPEGEGSSYAPALKNSAINMSYEDFVDVVVNGKKNVNTAENLVMPAFGTNKNVMCYLDDIYVYLKGRGLNAIPRGRPKGRVDKTDEIRETENACLGNE